MWIWEYKRYVESVMEAPAPSSLPVLPPREAGWQCYQLKEVIFVPAFFNLNETVFEIWSSFMRKLNGIGTFSIKLTVINVEHNNSVKSDINSDNRGWTCSSAFYIIKKETPPVIIRLGSHFFIADTEEPDSCCGLGVKCLSLQCTIVEFSVSCKW